LSLAFFRHAASAAQDSATQVQEEARQKAGATSEFDEEFELHWKLQ